MIFRAVNSIAYELYCAAKKISQLPSVMMEVEPKFVSSQTVRDASGTTYAIIVKYARFGPEDGVADLAGELKAQGINVVVVTNGTPSPEMLELLRPSAHRVLIRRNVGRDFGAYRAATLLLAREGISPTRLLYFNDSMVYLKGAGLSAMVQRLASGPADLMGVFENHENSHHIGSFAFSVSGAVFSDPKVVRFWRRYRPYDLRPHAINRGEVLLSRQIKAAGYSVDTLYSAQKLAVRLSEMPVTDLVGLLRYLPTRSRQPHAANLLAVPANTAGALRRSGWANLPISSVATPRIGDFRLTRSVGRSGVDANLRDGQLVKDSLIDQLMASFIFNSQAHYGFGLYRRVMGVPLIKKDLVQRGVYLEHELMRVLDDLPAETAESIVRLLVNRGRMVRPPLLERFKSYNGLI